LKIPELILWNNSRIDYSRNINEFSGISPDIPESPILKFSIVRLAMSFSRVFPEFFQNNTGIGIAYQMIRVLINFPLLEGLFRFLEDFSAY
jgi:hypothetical protein